MPSSYFILVSKVASQSTITNSEPVTLTLADCHYTCLLCSTLAALHITCILGWRVAGARARLQLSAAAGQGSSVQTQKSSAGQQKRCLNHTLTAPRPPARPTEPRHWQVTQTCLACLTRLLGCTINTQRRRLQGLAYKWQQSEDTRRHILQASTSIYIRVKHHQTWLACLVTSDDSSGGITKLEHVPRNNTLGPVPDAACC